MLQKGLLLRAVIMGCPGSGKGTISSRINKHFDILTLSSGDLLRFNAVQQTPIGLKATKYMEEGQLVPDDLITDLVLESIKTHGEGRHWLLDGFPRTRKQAETLNKASPINVAINLIVPHEVIISRIAGRWTHMPSGRIYNTEFNPPKIAGRDDITGEPLSQRVDDQPENIRRRLDIYLSTMQPVVDFYREAGVLREFKGKESNKIWPEVFRSMATFIEPKMPLP
ncbi:GTP:AMP phosphotransferase AK3, mitochondrial [Neocloeon triangulifer]|uniref:GTP:AMP phosphotransferase AK3, mitochondrial n=1 Tax=Neocloeon triangulifer TaxID=2078957 RepID=UPI00286F7CE8|nr:GTP:AMP phosphotransferase AK3, mitochondrial [Neocloeon triangulifer]